MVKKNNSLLEALGYSKGDVPKAENILALMQQRLTPGEYSDLVELLGRDDRKKKYWLDAIIMDTVMRFMKSADGRDLTYTLDEKEAIYEDNSLKGQLRQVEWEAEQLRSFKKNGLSMTYAFKKTGEILNMSPDTVRSRMKNIKYQTQWLEFKESLRR